MTGLLETQHRSHAVTDIVMAGFPSRKNAKAMDIHSEESNFRYNRSAAMKTLLFTRQSIATRQEPQPT